jgi:spore maturation protein CgeB
MKYGVVPGLEQAGVECLLLDGEYRLFTLTDVEAQKQVLSRAIADFGPDFILVEGYFNVGHPAWIREVTRDFDRRIAHVYWAMEDPTFHGHVSLPQAKYYDCVLTTVEELVPVYRSAGKEAGLFLFACNPEFHRQVPPREEYRSDLVLVANNFTLRRDSVWWFLLPLLERGYDVKVWGRWWHDAKEPVNLLPFPGVYQGLLPYENLPAVYASAKLVLGLNFYDTSATQTSMRPFEVMGCGGGLYVSPYTKAQENIFGNHAFQVRNPAETIETVDRLLSLSDGQRQTLAEAAQRFVYDHHTYRHRAESIIRAVQVILERR